jgi:hypothetical protein
MDIHPQPVITRLLSSLPVTVSSEKSNGHEAKFRA